MTNGSNVQLVGRRLIKVVNGLSGAKYPEDIDEFPGCFAALDKNGFDHLYKKLTSNLELAAKFFRLFGFWRTEDPSCQNTMDSMFDYIKELNLPDSHEVLDWLMDSNEAYASHEGVSSIYAEARMFQVYSNGEYLGLDVELWGFSNLQEILWGRKRFTEVDLIVSCMEAAMLGYLDNDPVISTRKIRPWKPCPLFAFHPERFKQTRRYISSIPERSIHNVDDLNYIAGCITEEFNRLQSNTLLNNRDRLGSTNTTGVVHQELDKATLYCAYRESGGHIFDVSGDLTGMFRHTSVDDIPVADLNSPYRAYYVHFGPQSDIPLDGEWLVDGVYVQHEPKAGLLQFVFTTYPEDPKTLLAWHQTPEPSFALAIAGDHYDQLLGVAVAATIEERRTHLRDKINRGNTSTVTDTGVELLVNAKLQGEHQLAIMERRLSAMQSALELAVNAMCYLTAYPDDIVSDWPVTTPQDTLVKTRKGHPVVRQNNISKLESQGYRKIHIAGRSLRKGPAKLDKQEVPGIRTHWRRGHWKRQPHGPGNTLRKMVWIKPTLVNSGDATSEPLSTIYEATKDH